MPIDKISELMKKITIEPDKRVDDLLLKIEKVKDSPAETAEVITMLFSIVDTNNKKNQQIMVEITSILLLLAVKNNSYQKKESNNDSKRQDSKKIGLWNSLPPTAKTVLSIGATVSFVVALFFIFYKIDPKATDSAVKHTTDIESHLTTPIKGKK